MKTLQLTETISQAEADAFLAFHHRQHNNDVIGLRPVTPAVDITLGASKWPECVSLSVTLDMSRSEDYPRLIDALFTFLAGHAAGRHSANMDHLRSVVQV